VSIEVVNTEQAAAWDGHEGDVWTEQADRYDRASRRIWQRFVESKLIGRADRVVDLGCGSGRLAHRLVEQGYDVLGIDISPAMIRLARQHEPRARYRVGSFLKIPLPGCAAVTSLGECLGYAFDTRNGEAAVEKLFGRVHRALEPGGLFVFDVLEPWRGAGSRAARGWASGPDWAVLVERREDRRAKLLSREITSFRQAGKAYRRTDEVHRVRLLERDFVARALRRQGFLVRVINGYGVLRFERGHVGFVARKRAQ
jgi:SAM-dependent methyltransferase